MIKNFLITGTKGSGKSFVINAFLENYPKEISGFKTLPYIINGRTTGHYFHSLVSVKSVENNLPFTIRQTNETCLAVNEIFLLLGVPCLSNSLKDHSPLVVMDEIGSLEAMCSPFLDLVFSLLESEKTVLAAVKKADTPHIGEILSRNDSLVLDLDILSCEEVLAILNEHILGGKEK